jgi:chromate transport protein ChrA
VGALRFTHTPLGGTVLAVIIVLLLLASATALSRSPVIRKFGSLCTGLALGTAVTSLVAIYRGEMEQLQQLADSGTIDLEALLSRMEFSQGAYLLGAGLLLWLAGAVLAFAVPSRARPGGAEATV